MNEKSLKKLEYDKIIGFLMQECSSPLGREKAEKLMPHREKVIVEGWQRGRLHRTANAANRKVSKVQILLSQPFFIFSLSFV